MKLLRLSPCWFLPSVALASGTLIFGCSSENNDADGSDGGAGEGNGSSSGGGSADGGGGTGADGAASGGGPAAWGPGDENEGSGGPPGDQSGCATTGSVSDRGTIWDSFDDEGPDDHNSLYGKKPRVTAAPRGDGSFDFAWQTEEGAGSLFVTHVAPSGDGYGSAFTVEVPSLGQIGGLAFAEGGDVVVATAISENISGSTSPLNTHRDGILQVVRIGANCTENYRQNLRTDFDGGDELPIYQPFQAGSARLVVAGDTYMLHYAQMTEYDAGVSSRHQIGRYLRGSVADGSLEQVLGSISHSFDQRLRFDGENFVSLALGDASLRGIQASRITPGGEKSDRTLFAVKGGDGPTGGGYNNTFTRLGAMSEAQGGYVALFVSEAGDVQTERVNVSRNLAWTHLPGDFSTIEQSETYDVVATDTAAMNDQAEAWDVSIKDYWGGVFTGHNRGVVWLTTYADLQTEHAERPKLVRYNANRFFVLWEKWSLTDYVETMAMVVDASGKTIVEARALGALRLSRGDDAFLLDNQAAWLDSHDGQVFLHRVDVDLEVSTDTL